MYQIKFVELIRRRYIYIILQHNNYNPITFSIKHKFVNILAKLKNLWKISTKHKFCKHIDKTQKFIENMLTFGQKECIIQYSVIVRDKSLFAYSGDNRTFLLRFSVFSPLGVERRERNASPR